MVYSYISRSALLEESCNSECQVISIIIKFALQCINIGTEFAVKPVYNVHIFTFCQDFQCNLGLRNGRKNFRISFLVYCILSRHREERNKLKICLIKAFSCAVAIVFLFLCQSQLYHSTVFSVVEHLIFSDFFSSFHITE